MKIVLDKENKNYIYIALSFTYQHPSTPKISKTH